jgi:hypothetical protein
VSDWQQHVYIRLQYTSTRCEHQKNTKVGAHLPHLLNEVLVSEIFGTDLTLVFLSADSSAANGTFKIMPSPTVQPHVLLRHPTVLQKLCQITLLFRYSSLENGTTLKWALYVF